jgi:SET and MYND domain-containing protein
MKLSDDEDSCFQLCIRAHFLKIERPDQYDAIWNLHQDSIVLDEAEMNVCRRVCSLLIEQGLDISIEWVTSLFKKDKCCGFAIMLPPNLRSDMNQGVSGTLMMINDVACQESASEGEEENEEEEEEESCDMIRGFGIYPGLSYCNHSCLPNSIRWDHADSPETSMSPHQRRMMEYRALHNIPVGSEILHSYVPIGWDLIERQYYLQSMFGFKCLCPRCILEISDYDSTNENELIGLSYDPHEVSAKLTGVLESGIDMNYVEAFLLRHLCSNESCTGTLTPAVSDSNIYICNVCGYSRDQSNFLIEITR